jgi:type I restriction enzyme S subunit
MIVRSTAFVTAMSELVQGALYPAVRPSDIRDFTIPIPPLAEQRRIVAKVEELTARSRAARAALAEVPTLLEQFRQSVLASAFRGDLTADWRAKNPTAEPASVLLDRIRAERRKQWETKYPKKKYAEPEPVDDSDLPELPEGWCWASVDELAEVQLGQRRAPEYIGKAEYAYIRSANITWDGLDLTDVKRMGFDDAEPLLLRRGDILLNEASGSPTEVGKPALWNDEIPACCLQATVLRLRGNSTEVSPLWLFYHSLRDALLAEYAAKCPGLGIIHLTAKLLRKWPVALAPLAEQREIIRRLDLAERQRRSTASAVSVALQDNDALDQSILAKAFRGELVPQDPTDEPAAALLARIRSGVSATRSVERGRVKFYILLLLRTWNKPLGREMLERGLVLMLNADVRRAILGRSKPVPKRGKKPATPPRFVAGLDLFLGEMLDDGDLVPGPEAGFFAEGQHGFDLVAVPQIDLDAVRETAEAMKVIHKDKLQATDADIVSALHGEIYELVS